MLKSPLILAGLGVMVAAGVAWQLLIDGQPSGEYASGGLRTDHVRTVPEIPQPDPEPPPLSGQRLITEVTPKPGRIRGVIRTTQGALVENAQVSIDLTVPPGKRNYALVASFSHKTSSDEEGRFDVSVPGGGLYRVVARKKGLAPGRVEGVQPGALIDVRLPAPAVVSGRVIDDESELPLEGVQVVAHFPNALGTEKAETDSTGAFSLSTLPQGLVSLAFDAPEYISTSPQEHEVAPGERKELLVRLSLGKVIRGEVLSGIDQLPIRDAQIEIGKRRGITDERGRFEVPGLGPERHSVRATARGFLPQWRQANLSGSRRQAKIIFKLQAGASVSGRVQNADGEPIVEAKISLHQSSGNGSQRSFWQDWATAHLHIRTNDFGHYEIKGIQANKWSTYVVRAQVEGRPDAYSQPLKVQFPHDRILADIRFGAGARVAGQVIDKDRNPISGARVTLRSGNSNSWSGRTRGGAATALLTGTDHEGRFSFSGLSEGGYDLEIDARGYSRGWKRGLGVTATDGPPHVEIQLWKGSPVAGIVTDTERQPLEGVRVVVSSKGGQGEAVTTPEGRFEIEAVPGAPWNVQASADGYGSHRGRAVQPDADGLIRIAMAPQAVLKGQVLDAVTKQPVRAFRIHLSQRNPRRQNRMENRYHREFHDREGRFSIQMADGEYRMDIQAAGFVSIREENIAFKAGDPLPEKVIEIKRGGAIEGYVRTRTGNPMNEVTIYRRRALSDERHFVQVGETEHDGYFLVPDLDAGLYDLAFQRRGYAVETDLSVRVGAEHPAWREISLDRETALQLVVKTPKSKGKAQRPEPAFSGERKALYRRSRNRTPTSVTIESLDHEPLGLIRRGRTPSGKRSYELQFSRKVTYRGNANATLTDLPAGRYRVRATQKGLPAIPYEAHLSYGDRRKLVFDFAKLKEQLRSSERTARSPGR